jgi:predicted transcriptional regulator of viral defense system
MPARAYPRPNRRVAFERPGIRRASRVLGRIRVEGMRPQSSSSTEWAHLAHHLCAEEGHPRRMPPAPSPADGTQSRDIDRFGSRRRDADREIARIAARQHGLITLEQLRELGISKDLAHQRACAGRLHRVHEGVYSVGHSLLTSEGLWLAAVLACGSGAVLSHRSAAALWGIRDNDAHAFIDVTAPNRRGRKPPGIAAHRDGVLAPRDCTSVRGIPCTTVEKTLLDLAAVIPVWQLRKALAEAEVLRIVDLTALRALLRRSRGRRGVARLRLILDELHPQTKRTRSELERLFLRMCNQGGLPQPEVNAALDVGGRKLKPDFLWRDAGLIVETDSRRYHDTDSAFQHDRRREQCLQLAGWRVSRCTWEQVEGESRRLALTIRGLLAQQNPRRRDPK